MKNDRFAVKTISEIKYSQQKQVDAVLVKRKGDVERQFGIFGKKHVIEHNVWDLKIPFMHEMIVDDDYSYIELDDKLFLKPRVIVWYCNNRNDTFYFTTNEEAIQYYNDLNEKFELTEIEKPI